MSNPESNSLPARWRTVFMGTGEIGRPAFDYLIDRADCDVVGVLTQPDKPAGRNRELKASVIKAVATAAGIPVFQPATLRQPEAAAVVADWMPDLIVVMAFGQILPRVVLDLPRMACLNLHASILPKFRGASPIHAAIAAGERETGISVMHMEEGLDTGDVLWIEREPIKRRDTSGILHDRLAHTAARALANALNGIRNGTAIRTPQDDSMASYAGRLTRDDAIIDWSADAASIERKIRAMNPWPVAWTSIPMRDGPPREVKVFSAIVIRDASGTPGAILRVDERGIMIAAGQGGILLRDIQMQGRKRMSAGDWQRGASVAAHGIAGR